MDEFYIKDDRLISKNEWQDIINSFKLAPEIDIPEHKIVLEVRRLFEQAVKQRLEGADSVGICFSGGLDSSYIAALCKRYGVNFTCYTVGFRDGNFKDPDDVIEAIRVAEHLKLDDDEFRYNILDIKELEKVFGKAYVILRAAEKLHGVAMTDVVNVEVASVEIAAHNLAIKDRADRMAYFFSGLGSEEIFAGYDRHRKNPSNEECKNGLVNMYDRDMLRDSAVPKASGFSFMTPFLDEELVRYSLKIPIRYKVDEDSNKIILRKSAEDILGNFAKRPKKAAQYGSSFDRGLSKIALLHGYKLKKDYLKSLN